MPDLTTLLAATCATNTGWSKEVEGSKGAHYTVRWCFQPGGDVQYGYECTCPSFLHGHRPCKHIRQILADDARCGWNEALEPTLTISEHGRCPSCGGPVAYLRVGV